MLAGQLALPMYLLALRWYLPSSAPFYRRERLAIGSRHCEDPRPCGHTSWRTLSWTGSGTARRRRGTFPCRCSRSSASSRPGSTTPNWWKHSAILVTGFYLVRADTVTIGATTAAALCFHRLFNPIGVLLIEFDQVQTAAAGLARLAGVLELPEGHLLGLVLLIPR